MPISAFYRSIRERVGTDLLLIPGVAGVVRDDEGRILLQLTHDDEWSLPAGAIEPGQSPAVAVVREVKEETGLDVRPTRLLGVLGGRSCRVRYDNGDQVEYVVTAFECRVASGAPIESNEETKALRWFLPEEMPELAFGYPAEILHGTQTEAYFDYFD